MTHLLLSLLASASHRRESTLLRRYPTAEPTIAALLASGFAELHQLDPRALRITIAGRAELRRLRDGKAVAA